MLFYTDIQQWYFNSFCIKVAISRRLGAFSPFLVRFCFTLVIYLFHNFILDDPYLPLQLTQSSETTSLGLILLHTASEELAVPREDLSMARREELHKLLLQQVPSILNLLNSE